MRIEKKLLIWANCLYCLLVLLCLLDLFHCLEIKGDKLQGFIRGGAILPIVPLTVSNLLVFRKSNWKYVSLLPQIFVVCGISFVILQIGIWGCLFSSGTYHTQTILYKSVDSDSRTVEFQLKNLGGFGYDGRVVEVTYFTPWFMLKKEIDPEKKPGSQWIKVNKDVNELELKY